MTEYFVDPMVRRARSAARFEALDPDECQLCGAHGPDKRSLFIDCGYALYEAVDEVIDIRDLELERGRGYYLLLCKSCRGRLLAALERWAEECRLLRGLPKDSDGGLDEIDPDRNIPVRVHGAIQMMTRDEYDEHRRRADEL